MMFRISTLALLSAFVCTAAADAQSLSLASTSDSSTHLGSSAVATPHTPNRMQIRFGDSGQLTIIGTYFDDFVQITRSGGTLRIRAEQRINGEAFWDEYREIPTEDVYGITFIGHEGDDLFAANVEIVTYAEGGDGDDVMVCGGHCFGGDGNDLLIASGYTTRFGQQFGSQVYGEGGDDEIWGSTRHDYLDGGTGFNTIHGDEEDVIRNASRPFTRPDAAAGSTTGELSLD